MKILGIDLGRRRIGLALGNTDNKLAVGLPTIINNKNVFKQISQIVNDNNIQKLIVGLPKTLSGKTGQQASYTQKWAKDLSNHLGVSIEYEDERLSSKMARDSLIAVGQKLSKEGIDQAAAVLILQHYLDKLT